jgi:hypothetical protein
MFGEVEVALYVSITESLQFIIVVIFIQETTHYLLAFGFRVLGLGVILALLRLWRWRTGREGHWRRNERHSCDWRRRGQEDHRPTGGGDVIELELLAGLCRRIWSDIFVASKNVGQIPRAMLDDDFVTEILGSLKVQNLEFVREWLGRRFW